MEVRRIYDLVDESKKDGIETYESKFEGLRILSENLENIFLISHMKAEQQKNEKNASKKPIFD